MNTFYCTECGAPNGGHASVCSSGPMFGQIKIHINEGKENMPMLHIHMTADGMGKGRVPDYVAKDDIEIGVLEGGMDSGKPSVAMLITLEDGKQVFAQTSLALFQAAAKAFAARYGWIE